MPTAFRSFVFSIILCFAAPLAAQEAPVSPDPQRVAAARDLMQVTGVTKQLDGMIEAMTRGFSHGANAENSEAGKKLSAEFEGMMKRFMSYKEDMMNDFAVLYAETFTAEEMKTVADFYRSGTGAKFIAMTPELMQKGATIGMKYSEKMMKEMKDGAKAP